MAKNKEAFILTRPKKSHADGKWGVIKVDADAYNLLVDMSNESGMPISKIASKAVSYAYDNLEFEER